MKMCLNTARSDLSLTLWLCVKELNKVPYFPYINSQRETFNMQAKSYVR